MNVTLFLFVLLSFPKNSQGFISFPWLLMSTEIGFTEPDTRPDLTPKYQAAPWSPSFYTWKTWRGRRADHFALLDLFFLRQSSWRTAPVTPRTLLGRGCEEPRPALRQRGVGARLARWVSPQPRGGSKARDPAAPSGVHVLSWERLCVSCAKKCHRRDVIWWFSCRPARLHLCTRKYLHRLFPQHPGFVLHTLCVHLYLMRSAVVC